MKVWLSDLTYTQQTIAADTVAAALGQAQHPGFGLPGGQDPDQMSRTKLKRLGVARSIFTHETGFVREN